MSSGSRSGVPHGTWRRRRIEDGDPVFYEMAAAHDRNHAALMRSAWLGQLPDEAKRMMDTCLAALDAALAGLTPGNTALRVYGKFTVGVSETALVTETGCEQLGTFARAGDPVSGQSNPGLPPPPAPPSPSCQCITPP